MASTPAPLSPPSIERRTLSRSEIAQLTAVSLCAERTIVNWWTGRARVLPATVERLTRAAKELGISDYPGAA